MNIEIVRVNGATKAMLFRAHAPSHFPSIRMTSELVRAVNGTYGDILFIPNGKPLEVVIDDFKHRRALRDADLLRFLKVIQ